MKTSAQTKLLAEFVADFKRAITQEMEAMRQRLGPFEVPLAYGERLESEEGKDEARYFYRLTATEEKLAEGMECSLRAESGEYLVRVERLEGALVTLWSGREIAVGDGRAALVIYPWFLYEKLLTVLGDIHEADFSVDKALALFGKLPPDSRPRQMRRDHAALNEGQRAAVQRCLDNELAFVWGPPGTGKTTTLAHIVDELSAHGMRLLVLSTTNAALDQALEKIALRPAMAKAIGAGAVVRIGRGEGAAGGAGLREVTSRINQADQEKLDRLLLRRPELDAALRLCDRLAAELPDADEPFQQGLFADIEARPAPPELQEVFSAARAARLALRPPNELAGIVQRRAQRLNLLSQLISKEIAQLRKRLVKKEQGAVDQAAVVLATLTNAYFSPLMRKQRFDAVIVEEASMAVLPALFYAACLAREKTIMVGDPCQLPSIVQSDAPFVRQVMGRNIFEVTVPEPLASPLVAMLDVQYRMHPVIGRLVSDSFYFGKLRHQGDKDRLEAIAALEPYAGEPLVLLDTSGRTTCRQGASGQSRGNAATADICVDLALRAVRGGAESVAIITPYAEQARAIRALLRKEPGDAKGIDCSTVHRFQGREKDVIILDTVDAEPMRPGILLSERDSHSSAQKLINVAISRARGKLVIVADAPYFRSRAPEGVAAKVIARALAIGRHEVWQGAAAMELSQGL